MWSPTARQSNPDPKAARMVEADEFKELLVQSIPALRAYARSLTGSADRADDLVQEALTKAWAARKSFQPGTFFRAWIFTILRNTLFSQQRRNDPLSHSVPEDQAYHIAAVTSPESSLHVDDFRRALSQISADQREALTLVIGGGLSYEEAAQVMNCAVGTIKSRVARARRDMERMIVEGTLPPRRRVTNRPSPLDERRS
jgi:RNA polymerase sigma-70 factor (ECF subfamily)